MMTTFTYLHVFRVYLIQYALLTPYTRCVLNKIISSGDNLWKKLFNAPSIIYNNILQR